jgi:Xaa-Pro aminopeptidase
MSAVGARPAILAERYGERLSRAQARAAGHGFAALLLGVGPDLRYLLGYNALPLERLTMLIIPAAGSIRLVAPRLEATPARSCPAAAAGFVEVVTWEETDDPHRLVGTLVADASAGAAGGAAGGSGGAAGGSGLVLGVSDSLTAMHLLRLQAVLPNAAWASAVVVRELRIVKDADEVALLRLAAQAADRVIEAVSGGPLVGRTEADVAREVGDRLIAEGHDTSEFAIVASGPNSASPHHEASERVIRAGEPVVLDIGGTLGGYASDITRTVWVTGGDPARGPDAEFLRIFDLVAEAQGEATASARPGVPAERVDAVARGIIAGGGYGERFIHRVGHGIGLEGHEDPYLVAGNAGPLSEGMAFSVEPGIYLDGRYGVRIEDIVVCGPAGPIVLNEAPRELRIVAG